MSKLSETLKALNGKFGKNYIMKWGDCEGDLDYKRTSTGNLAVDFAIGGGIPERKVMMAVGRSSTGKTTIGITATAAVQKAGGKVAWLDGEHSLDPVWASKFGVKFEDIILAQPNTIEECTDTIEPLIMTGDLDLIVVDSIAAFPSIKELEDSSEQKSMGGTAKVIGLMMRKIVARLNDNSNPVKTSVLLINQLRQNIGGYGPPEYCPGGMQLQYQTDITIWLRKESEPVGGKDTPRGITVNFKVEKNRTFPPLKIGHYDLLWEGKIDNNKALMEKAIECGVVKKAGPWYSYNDRKASGLDNFIEGLSEKESEKIKEEVYSTLAKPTEKKKEDE